MAVLAQTVVPDLVDELTAHAVASIEAADHFSFPFPHIVFRNFFPADFCRDLLRSVPTEGYDRIRATGSRVALRLYGENIEKIDPALRPAWAAVSTMLTSKGLERAIRNRLHDGLEIRARGDRVPCADDLKLVAKPVIYRDRDGYWMKPHPDKRRKVVTMQLYCPADSSQEALGTTLYRASLKGLFSCWFFLPGASKNHSLSAQRRIRVRGPEGLPLAEKDELARPSANQDRSASGLHS